MFNATSVVRAVAGVDPLDFDLHVNVVGGANIDGPSAGLAVFLVLYSAITKTPLPQDVAVTGELSITGDVRPVGGIVEKLYAARQAGMRLALVPAANAHDLDTTIGGLEIRTVTNVADAFAALGIAYATPRPRHVRKAAR